MLGLLSSDSAADYDEQLNVRVKHPLAQQKSIGPATVNESLQPPVANDATAPITASRVVGQDRMRVVVDARVLKQTKTGVEIYCSELLKGLARRDDIELTALCLSSDQQELVEESAEQTVHCLRVRNWMHPASLLLPPHWLTAGTLLHCPTPILPFIRKPTGVRLIVTIHDLVPLIRPEEHKWSYRLYFRRVLPRLLRMADGVIADSESTARDVQRYFSQTPISVVPLAARWPPVQQIEPKEDYLLAVGTLEPRKNLHRVIEAFLQLKRAQPSWATRLLLVGRQGWKQKGTLDLIARNSDAIQWLGYLPDDQLQSLMRRAKGLVYPSLYEGFGLPVLEAMSVGCPVIISNVSSLPEVGGDVVMYVNPDDTEEITRQIKRLITDSQLRDDLAKRGMARASQFSWQRVASETFAVYRQVLGLES